MKRIALSVAALALLFAAGCSSPSPAGHGISATDDSAFAKPPAPSIDRAQIRAGLAAHREEQIARLHAYAEAGQFPHNATVAPSLHMFRDMAGRYCAVANLVHRDGRDDLVDDTVRDQNDLAVADVHDGPMMDWILGSGLTQEELVRIQLPAPYIGRRPKVRPGPSPAQINVAVVEDAPLAVKEARMDAAIRAHVLQMETELREGSAQSLDLAVERWIARDARASS